MSTTTIKHTEVHDFYRSNNLRVLPIPVGVKCPIEKGWPSSQKLAADIEQDLLDPRYNKYGWLLDDCHLVVDIDVHDPEKSGFDSLVKLEGELGYMLEDVCGAIVETPSGGRHYYFTKPDDLKFGKVFAKQYPGIDFIHGRGKQVIAANSAHDKHDGIYTLRGDGELLEAPASMFSHLQALAPSTQKATPTEPHGERSGDEFQRSSRGLQLIIGELAGRGYEIRQRDGYHEFDRPDKTTNAGRSGHVGKLSKAGNYQLTCFSLSDECFPSGESMTIFHAYALLCCGGDHSRAASALFERGFAMQNLPTVNLSGITSGGADLRHNAPADILPPKVEQFRPFPVDALPEPLREFVVAAAKAIGCDPSFLALPLLSALAATIGNSRCLLLKRGWCVPSILWTAIVGESGTLKTPAFRLVLKPLRQMQQRELKKHAELMEKHATEIALYEKEMTAWKRKGNNEPPPEKPTPPPAVRFIVSDTTVEALAPLLLDNPRGLLMARDELAGWLGSFDRYAGKGGADASHWLSMFNGESLTVDRKTGQPRTIYVPSAAVSVCGGIQPGILNRALGVEHRESGLAARILLACPPRKPKRWTENDIDPRAEKRLSELFERLHQLQPAIDENDSQQPIVLGMTTAAKRAWVRYYNEHAKEQNDLTGDLAAAWSKLEETAARLALIVNCVRQVAGGPDVVDEESMSAGIELATWFKHEARRVYSMFAESDEGREQRMLLDLIHGKGGSVTPRDLMRSSRKWATSGDAELALCSLVKAGFGQWVEQSTTRKGGRPTRVFQTVDAVDVDTTPLNTGKNGSCVNVDTVDTPETHIGEEWGEL